MVMPRNTGEMVQHGDDRSLFVEFYNEPVFMEYKSKIEGRPIYEERVFVHMLTPGGKTDIRRQARLAQDGSGTPSDAERFPKQWQAFQSQHEQADVGTPLTELAFLTKAQALEYKALKIHTAEQLAAIPDAALDKFGLGARAVRDKARAYLDSAAATSAISALEAENGRLKNDLAMMKDQIAQIASQQKSQPVQAVTPDIAAIVQEQLAAAMAGLKRGPGRPRKDDDNGD
jgi:hypothetical protein